MIPALVLALAATTAPVDATGWLVSPLRLDDAPSSSATPPPSSPPPPAPRAGRAAASPRLAAAAAGSLSQAQRLRPKSPVLALGLSLALELPTLFLGPSLGHLYAGDWQHFVITGSARLADVALLVLLEKFWFGIGPLVAIANPQHLGASFAGYPLGFTVDLLLVLALIGSSVYDLVDSWRAAERFNAKLGLQPATANPRAMAAVPAPAR